MYSSINAPCGAIGGFCRMFTKRPTEVRLQFRLAAEALIPGGL
jgi:hypothetical protein